MHDPFQPFCYDAAMKKIFQLADREVPKERLLAVGDGLPTDIKGAALNGFDVYFITGGIHAAEMGDLSQPANLAKLTSSVAEQFPGIRLAGVCEQLRWT